MDEECSVHGGEEKLKNFSLDFLEGKRSLGIS
jgi:hypothetical protein